MDSVFAIAVVTYCPGKLYVSRLWGTGFILLGRSARGCDLGCGIFARTDCWLVYGLSV